MLEDDALDVVGGADGEEGAGVLARVAGHDAAWPGKRELLQGGPKLGVGPVHEQLAVEPQQVESPEGTAPRRLAPARLVRQCSLLARPRGGPDARMDRDD